MRLSAVFIAFIEALVFGPICITVGKVTSGLAAITSCVRCHAVCGIFEKLAAAFAKVIEPFWATGSVIGIDKPVEEAFGFASATPLSQTNFLPDFTQVNFFVAVELTKPALVHVAPDVGDAAEAEVGNKREATKMAADAQAIFLMADINSIPWANALRHLRAADPSYGFLGGRVGDCAVNGES